MEANSLLNLAQLRVDNCKLNTTNKTNTKGKFEAWFWNKSANETDLNTEKKGNNNHKKNFEDNKFRTEKPVSSEVYKIKIK